ncbi:MAG: hypothetical protein ACI4V7_04915 [Succinivibrionaceae bacterium]
MKTITSGLIMFIMAFLTLGCEKNAQNDKKIEKEFQKIFPEEFLGFKTKGVSLDGNSKLNVTLLATEETMNQPYVKNIKVLSSILPQILADNICLNKNVKYKFSKFINDKNSVSLNFKSSSFENLLTLDISPQLCINNTPDNYNFSSAKSKQEKQGFYDEEFLNHQYIRHIKKQLPSSIGPGFNIVDISAGPGSVLTIIVDYIPTNIDEDYNTSVNLIRNVLNSIYNTSCSDPNTKNLIQMVKKTSWIGRINGKAVTALTANRNCKPL